MSGLTHFTDERDTQELDGDTVIQELFFQVDTPDIRGAGTDATVQLSLLQKKFQLGNEEKYKRSLAAKAGMAGVFLVLSPHALFSAATIAAYRLARNDAFERGQTDGFTIPVGCRLRELRQSAITLSHDGGGLASDWYVGKTELFVHVEGEKHLRTYKAWGEWKWLVQGQLVQLQAGF